MSDHGEREISRGTVITLLIVLGTAFLCLLLFILSYWPGMTDLVPALGWFKNWVFFWLAVGLIVSVFNYFWQREAFR